MQPWNRFKCVIIPMKDNFSIQDFQRVKKTMELKIQITKMHTLPFSFLFFEIGFIFNLVNGMCKFAFFFVFSIVVFFFEDMMFLLHKFILNRKRQFNLDPHIIIRTIDNMQVIVKNSHE